MVPPLCAPPPQVLRVAGEQHGVFAVPSLRACLRVTNPSAALLAVLSQVGTRVGEASFALFKFLLAVLSQVGWRHGG